MKTLILLSLMSVPVLAYDSGAQEASDWLANQEILREQARASDEAAKIQADATDRQTDAIQNQTFASEIANQNNYTLQLAKIVLEAQAHNPCQYRMLVKNLKTQEPEYFIGQDGTRTGPLYVKDCGQYKGR